MWYLTSPQIINSWPRDAQLLRKVNANYISDNVKQDKGDKSIPKTVQLEDVLSEQPPPSKYQQLFTKIARFVVELLRQSAVVVAVFLVFYVLSAPLLVASELYEMGSREYTFRYVASVLTGIFLLIGFLELGLHMLEEQRIYKFRFWLQRILHLYMAFIVWVGMAYLFLVATWFLLGILINPERSLPYGSAVATLAVHAATTMCRLKAWKEKVVGAFKDALDSAMRVVPVTLAASTVDTVIQHTRQIIPGSLGNSGSSLLSLYNSIFNDKTDTGEISDPLATLSHVMKNTREVIGNADQVNQLGEQHQETLNSIIGIYKLSSKFNLNLVYFRNCASWLARVYSSTKNPSKCH
jgi:hypothetical protein